MALLKIFLSISEGVSNCSGSEVAKFNKTRGQGKI